VVGVTATFLLVVHVCKGEEGEIEALVPIILCTLGFSEAMHCL